MNPYESPADCGPALQTSRDLPSLWLIAGLSLAGIVGWFAAWATFVFMPGSPSERWFIDYPLAYKSITAVTTSFWLLPLVFAMHRIDVHYRQSAEASE
jgi:hypothetical protein